MCQRCTVNWCLLHSQLVSTAESTGFYYAGGITAGEGSAEAEQGSGGRAGAAAEG